MMMSRFSNLGCIRKLASLKQLILCQHQHQQRRLMRRDASKYLLPKKKILRHVPIRPRTTQVKIALRYGYNIQSKYIRGLYSKLYALPEKIQLSDDGFCNYRCDLCKMHDGLVLEVSGGAGRHQRYGKETKKRSMQTLKQGVGSRQRNASIKRKEEEKARHYLRHLRYMAPQMFLVENPTKKAYSNGGLEANARNVLAALYYVNRDDYDQSSACCFGSRLPLIHQL